MSFPIHGRAAGALLATAALAAAGLGAFATVAQAEPPCAGSALVADYAAPTDPAENTWEFEGRISAVDTAARTVTVNGATFHVPDTLLVKTQSLDQATGNLTLDQLMDPALPTVVGNATVIASGASVYSTAADGTTQCVGFEAGSVYVEFAENVLVGTFMGATPDGSIRIAGAPVEMNTDPRFPATLVDGAGNELVLSDFAGHEGLLLEAEGYYSLERGALQATAIATEQIIKLPADGTDVVAVSRAQWDDRELRVGGAVSPAGAGKTVTIHDDGGSGGACDTSAVIGTAAVGADGAFSYRNRDVANPGTVCVASSGGGTAEAVVEAD